MWASCGQVPRVVKVAMDEKKITSRREANQIYYRVSSQDVAIIEWSEEQKTRKNSF